MTPAPQGTPGSRCRHALARAAALCLAVAWIAGSMAAPARAEDAPSHLVAGCISVANLCSHVPGGGFKGFAADLSRRLAEMTASELEFRTALSSLAIGAQTRGETQILAAVPELEQLGQTSIASVPVASNQVRLFALQERLDELAARPLEGLSIAYIEGGTGAKFPGLFAANEGIATRTPEELIAFLLGKRADLAVISERAVFPTSRGMGVDHRIAVFGPPLARESRVVYIHRSREALIGPVNSAIAEMEATGELAELRRRWRIDPPAPEPAVLRVGIAHSPPYGIIDPESGAVSGYAAEFFRELATRAGLSYSFVPMSLDEYFGFPENGMADILPVYVVSEAAQEAMDFTLPTELTQFAAFVRADGPPYATLGDLDGQPVAMRRDTIGVAAQTGAGGMVPLEIDDDRAMLEALLSGRAEALVEMPETVLRVAEETGTTGQIRRLEAPAFELRNAIALRFGLGAVREKLNAQLPGFALSDEFQQLRRAYFGAPVFWTPERQRLAVLAALAAAVLLLLFGTVTVLSLRAKRQAEALTRRTISVSSRLQAVMDSVQSGIVGLDAARNILLLNPSARRMLGASAGALPCPWPPDVGFLSPEDLRPLGGREDPVARALAGERLGGVTQMMSRDGAQEDSLYVRLASAPIEVPDSAIRTVMSIDDISEQERNRQQLERSGRLDALGQLTGGVAHDFNNLLATIEYGIQLAEQEAEPGARSGYLATALASVQRGAALTKRLLAFARRQPGLAVSRPVEEILRDFEALARPSIEARVALDFAAVAPGLWVYCDVAQLENALLNLVLNARDAVIESGKGDRITVDVRAVSDAEASSRAVDGSFPAEALRDLNRHEAQRGDAMRFRFVEFSVTDNGPGMTEEVKRRALDPFFTTKPTHAGTGLGLSMVYGFIQQSGGALRIYSEPGLGTTVRVMLPRGTPAGTREAPVELPPSPPGAGERVLVVEDEEALRQMTGNMLLSLGYKVETAADGSAALGLLEAGLVPDLLLTDIVMPGPLDGFALARAARQLIPALPVIYMSGYTGISAEEMGEVRAPLLQKPCPPSQLAETVRGALSGDPG
ncbi:transporter substrate-binding domain-containing protein [Poseidonocella sp. HB161398]|uniref:transporter substrate-binding domain-containing protein n=1 Tax=Poseidonocella sp. HB161398 TaxID=2320855 RepID=UPI001107DB9E|nr:transporter substrate-binding domain-containing protein [Poseidonocella sp. HB161398]